MIPDKKGSLKVSRKKFCLQLFYLPTKCRYKQHDYTVTTNTSTSYYIMGEGICNKNQHKNVSVTKTP